MPTAIINAAILKSGNILAKRVALKHPKQYINIAKCTAGSNNA